MAAESNKTSPSRFLISTLLCHSTQSAVPQRFEVAFTSALVGGIHSQASFVCLEFSGAEALDSLEDRDTGLDAQTEVFLFKNTVGLGRRFGHALVEGKKLLRAIASNIFHHDLVESRHGEYMREEKSNGMN